MQEETQLQNLNQIHTDNALTMLQVIMQKVTYEIIHAVNKSPDYYDKMCHAATDLAFWIRNIEKDYDGVEYTDGNEGLTVK